MGLSILALLVFLFGGALLILKQPKFGRHPEGARLERIERSPNYRDGQFHNLLATPSFSNDKGQFSALWEYFFVPKTRLRPDAPLPLVATDLAALPENRDIVVWLGHSSCFLQLGGKKILIDPVFASHASPFSFSTKAFQSDYPYSAAAMPAIDYLLITHDHWDHLDYATLTAMRDKIGLIFCPLGVGAHLEHWGFPPERIMEGDWFNSFSPANDVSIHIVPSRHFSGRTLTRNKSLWCGFVLQSAGRQIYISGDGGYGPHFVDAAKRFGSFDLALMENGQYDKNWQFVHMMPEESATAAQELGAKAVLPVHSGRFSISNHAWDDPYIRHAAASKNKSYRLLSPIIGQPVYLDDETQTFPHWWENVQ